jgi:hypothetical protein
MERTTVIEKITAASTPNDISNAMCDARSWLTNHPEDEAVRRGIQRLARAERELRS